jgi:ferric-dicitrate binding protein FerR (iron transport regulator)
MSEEETAAIKQEIWDKVRPVVDGQRKVWRLPAWTRVAAVILIIAGAAVTFLLLNKKSDNHPIAFSTFSTGTGEKKIITLQDGSQLTLDAATTIKVQDDFSNDRKITLEDGQVFFDVKTDAQRPFIIESNGLTTTVLGTSFSISAYTALNNISIGVVSGKISVVRDTANLGVLEKEEELVFNKTSSRWKKIPLDESMTAWQRGRLMMNDLSFFEMAAIMKKNFGTDIVTNDESIKNTRYTTELLTSMSPVKAVQVLAAIHHLKIREENNKIHLYK